MLQAAVVDLLNSNQRAQIREFCITYARYLSQILDRFEATVRFSPSHNSSGKDWSDARQCIQLLRTGAI
ncbi:hypothetical protein GALL_493300 [mine drainage metagenome]|uniref:Uncharacterized protein n=1 Tax=mine drainage metagenome TaxID=410659 RepID=A0A1J5PMS8_9ZZZZ